MALEELWDRGYAHLGKLLSAAEAQTIRGLYSDSEKFRSRIDMARYRFGQGEYQYFGYPLPQRIDRLRHDLYSQLAPAARDWMAALSLDANFPDDLDAFLKLCHNAGQLRPTPLLLQYRQGDFNCLHQDLYGEIVFPFQVVIALSRPGDEYEGGELLLVEQRPRAQSVGHVIHLDQGEAVAITTRYRPVRGSRGYYRTNMRHGVSPITKGERYTLGIIFHDAK